ncbi:MAG: monofunctional biosynthetic peptidoglycan transglycosylase [Gammaproteobacteria bacterium]
MALAVGILLIASGIVPVALLHLIDPPRTAFMLEAAYAARERGESSYTTDYRPVALAEISPWVGLAVITAEDQKFPKHRGFDVDAIQQALEAHREGGRLRGASTLSQQVAKNLFLWPGRSWLRKGLEAWYTVVLELLLPKSRILELHLNIAEYGPGVYGVEAAAQRYFGRSAAALDRRQAALLATVLPNPLRHRLSAPDPGMRRRQAWILEQMERLGGLRYLDRLEGEGPRAGR